MKNKPQYSPFYSTQFEKDIRLAQKRGLDLDKLESLAELLLSGQTLPPIYKDHPLKGTWKKDNYRDAHITPDWILIYKKDEDEAKITFYRTGTHSDLFG